MRNVWFDLGLAPGSNMVATSSKCSLDLDGEEPRHERITLLPPFRLGHVVPDAQVVPPTVTGWRRVRETNERQNRSRRRHPQQPFEHRSSAHMVVRPNPINAETGGWMVCIRCSSEHVPDAVCPSPCRQSVLEWCAFLFELGCKLFRKSSADKSPQ